MSISVKIDYSIRRFSKTKYIISYLFFIFISLNLLNSTCPVDLEILLFWELFINWFIILDIESKSIPVNANHPARIIIIAKIVGNKL